jgi:hypothetical protein
MPAYTGYQGSTYPSGQISTRHRDVRPGFAASDVWAGAPVKQVSQGDSTFVMCLSPADKPTGVARDYAAAGDAIAIYDLGNEVRCFPGAGASFTRDQFIGVTGSAAGAHPISAANVTYPTLGPVAGTPSVAVGASAAPTWAIGVSTESAAVGDQAAYVVEPRLLSGLVST